jgi:uncharacterized phosphosugar-binding protein
VVQSDGRVFVFGTGHSHVIAEETHYRAGGLAITVPILTGATTVKDGAVAGAVYERLSGIVVPILERYGVDGKDLLIVVSNSGVNAAPVEAARIGKQVGATVVALTSAEYSQRVAEGRPRIADIADIVLDNGSPAGDAVVALPGTPLKVGPVSTITGAAIINAVLVGVAARLIARGQEAPIYLSAGMEGASEVNYRLIRRYRDRNPHL